MAIVVWTDAAINDLNEIGEYIAKDSERYGQLVVERLFNSVDILETNPQSGKMVIEFDNEKIRELVRKNYRIIYRVVDSERIDIITIHRTERLRENTFDFSKIDDE